MKIVTSHDYPPIPDRSMDWSAIDEDTYDGAPDSGPLAHLIGRGPTEEAAIEDLRALLAEHDICSNCGGTLVNDLCVPCDGLKVP
jgi:hypothetical protein